MGDIISAMAREQLYLNYRLEGKEPFHLIDAVKEFGFASLEEYFSAKREYEFSRLEFDVIETAPERAISDVFAAISGQRTAVLFADTNDTIIWNGDNSEFNESYCNECGIPVYPLQTGGGTIVSTNGDLNIGICIPGSVGADERFLLSGLADIFRKYTDKPVEVVGNDILVGGYKAIGSSSYRSNEMFVLITPVSLSEKAELISRICTKHSEKQPRHIDFMEAETLRMEVLRWLKAKSI